MISPCVRGRRGEILDRADNNPLSLDTPLTVVLVSLLNFSNLSRTTDGPFFPSAIKPEP
jgi:hypothetical protein